MNQRLKAFTIFSCHGSSWCDELIELISSIHYIHQAGSLSSKHSSDPAGFDYICRGHRDANNVSVSRPGGLGSQLVNAACFLVTDDDARGNTVTHGLSWFRPRGRTSSKGGVRGHCIILHPKCRSRGYKRGERGSEAPKSLLEVELVEMSA